MAFHEVRFPASLSFGSVGGPERRSEIVTLANGYEERNSPWAQSRRRYDAGLGLRSLDDIEALLAFFEARAGQLHGFRWKDWADYRSAPASRGLDAEDQDLGLGDGATVLWPLYKTYRSGGVAHRRRIEKPVEGTVVVALNGDRQEMGRHVSLDPTTGILTFAVPPAPGQRISAGFEFDVPVRFDTDRIQVSVANFQAGHVPQVPVTEVRL